MREQQCQHQLSYSDFPQIRKHLESLEKVLGNSVPMYACWINVLTASNSEEDKKRAREICSQLETNLDVVRAKYWAHIGASILE
jgi:hypothetical protein